MHNLLRGGGRAIRMPQDLARELMMAVVVALLVLVKLVVMTVAVIVLVLVPWLRR